MRRWTRALAAATVKRSRVAALLLESPVEEWTVEGFRAFDVAGDEVRPDEFAGLEAFSKPAVYCIQ